MKYQEFFNLRLDFNKNFSFTRIWSWKLAFQEKIFSQLSKPSSRRDIRLVSNIMFCYFLLPDRIQHISITNTYDNYINISSSLLKDDDEEFPINFIVLVHLLLLRLYTPLSYTHWGCFVCFFLWIKLSLLLQFFFLLWKSNMKNGFCDKWKKFIFFRSYCIFTQVWFM